MNSRETKIALLTRAWARLAGSSRIRAGVLTSVLALCNVLPSYAQTSGCDQTFQCDATDFGGPVMPAPGIVLLFWLPAGVHFDPGGSASDVTYESLMKRFFTDVSPSSYYNILSEYPGMCPSDTPPASCFGPITSVMTLVDNNPYPHLGTQNSPVNDFDIHAELMMQIANNHWPTGIGVEYFVFLGWGIQECNDSFNMCTFEKPGGMGHSAPTTVIFSTATTRRSCTP